MCSLIVITVYVLIKKDIFLAETDTRERLSKYPRDKIDSKTIESEIADLKMTLNLSLQQAFQIKKFGVDLIQSYSHMQKSMKQILLTSLITRSMFS